MSDLPAFVSFVFGFATILTAWLFYRAAGNSKPFLLIALIWLVVQAIIANLNFYTVTDTLPSRFLLLVLPPFLCIMGLFMNPKGRKFMDNLDLKKLTILHTIRIPV